MARTSNRPRKTSHFNLPGAFSLFGPSRDLVLRYFWIFMPLYFFQLVFTFHTWIWTPSADSNTGHHWTDYSWLGTGFSMSSLPPFLWYTFVGFSVAWFLFVVAAGTATQIMTQEAQLEAAKGHQTILFSKLWATVKELGWRMFGLYLLMSLYIVVGFILLIVPGLIMLRRYFLAPYVMLDKKCSISEAMEESAALSKPFSGAIWGIIGVIVLIGLINILPFVGWMISFIFGTLYSLAHAIRYQQLKKLQSHIPELNS